MPDPPDSYCAIACNLALGTLINSNKYMALKMKAVWNNVSSMCCQMWLFNFWKRMPFRHLSFHLSELPCCTRSEYSALQYTCYVLIMYGWTMIDINMQVQCSHTEVQSTILWAYSIMQIKAHSQDATTTATEIFLISLIDIHWTHSQLKSVSL